MFSQDALIESLKECGRVVLLAVLPVAISAVESDKVDFKVLGIIAVLAVLRFVDKLLHEANKELPTKKQNDGYLGEKGITF